jgi:hypothetical protein
VKGGSWLFSAPLKGRIQCQPAAPDRGGEQHLPTPEQLQLKLVTHLQTQQIAQGLRQPHR